MIRHKIILTSIVTLVLASLAVGVTYSLTNHPLEINDLATDSTNNRISTDGLAVYDSILTEAEMIAILESLPEIQEFLTEFVEVDLYLYYDGEFKIWYASYFSYDDWMSYAFVTIDDNSGDVIDIDIWIASEETILTTQEVLDIALSNELVQEFITDHPDYEYSVFYDYYQYWYIDIYADHYFAWCSVIINDVNGEIVDVFISDYLVDAQHTVDEILAIALNDINVTQFIIDNPDYEYYIYVTEFYDTFNIETPDLWEESENLLWVVDFYSKDYTDWLSLWIDDVTGEIVDKWMTEPAEMTVAEIEVLVLSLPEVEEFLLIFEDVIWDIWYDGFGYWYISIWSEYQFEAYIFLSIDDKTGEVLYIESYIPVPPQYTEDAIIALIWELEEVQNFISNYTVYEIWTYFYDGIWYVDFCNDDYSAWLSIAIDDDSLEILWIEYYEWDDWIDEPF